MLDVGCSGMTAPHRWCGVGWGGVVPVHVRVTRATLTVQRRGAAARVSQKPSCGTSLAQALARLTLHCTVSEQAAETDKQSLAGVVSAATACVTALPC